MTSFEIQEYDFDAELVDSSRSNRRLVNWPAVYVLNRPGRSSKQRGRIYVGESRSFSARMKQHLEGKKGDGLRTSVVRAPGCLSHLEGPVDDHGVWVRLPVGEHDALTFS